jgi:endo-1,4-beta-xylanase
MRITLPLLALLAFASIAHAQLRGTVEQRSFLHQPSGRTVSFNIYLPEGYAAGSERYPVIYHLHGLGGSRASHNLTVPLSFENAQAQGVIGPVIIVFPDAYTDSWWADSANSDKPAETDVISRLLPYVDANFRTIDRRGGRVIQGFSMGGFGATKFFAKFTDLFSICLEYDGAFLTWSNMRLFFPQTAQEIFNNSEAYFNQFSPWYWTDVNAARLRDEHPIRMVVGILTGGNRSFRDHLAARAIPVDYLETSCAHDLDCLLNAQGLASAAFIAARLYLLCPADINRDGAVSSQDFFDFVTAFFAGDADFNGDGQTNSQDFFDFVGEFFGECA